jgi:predicted neuraminidase
MNLSHTKIRLISLKVLLGLASIAVVVSAAWSKVPPVKFAVPPTSASHLLLTGTTLSLPVTTPSVHAVSLAALPSGQLLAAWFGGKREGATNVSIFLSRFDGQHWSPAETIMTPALLNKSTGHFARKLGNPVLHFDSKGQLHLFVVSVGIGGWGMAFLNHAISHDEGRHFDNAERLRISPLLNMSHLVRSPAINLADGGFILPVYFEMGWKYPVILRFDSLGKLISRQRIPGPAHLLQPSLSVHGPSQAVAFSRDAGKIHLVHASRFSENPQSDFGAFSGWKGVFGNSWTASVPTTMGNPDSSVAVLPAADGGHWLAGNPDNEFGRRKLVLQKLDRNLAKKEVFTAIQAVDGEFSYPALAQTDDGRVHLVYTDRRKGLTHRIFEPAHD